MTLNTDRGHAVSRASAAALAGLFILTLIATCWLGAGAALADDPPDWRRIRTNSVPYMPNTLTVDSTGDVWVTSSDGYEYDPGVWHLPAGASPARFQYLTNSKANNYLVGDYDNLVVKTQLNTHVLFVAQDDRGDTWYGLNDRRVLCEKANGQWLTITMPNTYVGMADTTNVDSVHRIRLIGSGVSQKVLLIAYKSIVLVNPDYSSTVLREEWSSANNYMIEDAYIDSQARYWVCTGYGLQQGTAAMPNGDYVANHPEYADDLDDVPPNYEPITRIEEDSAGNMWFVNSSYGTNAIYCLKTDGDWVKTTMSAHCGASNVVLDMVRGAGGTMWFATYYSGIVHYSPDNGGTWTHITCTSLGLKSELTGGLAYKDGVLWFCTGINSSVQGNGTGVHALTLGSRKAPSLTASYTYRESSTSLTSHRIQCIAADLDGGVWFPADDDPSVAWMKPDGTWEHFRTPAMEMVHVGYSGYGGITGIGVDSNNIVYMAPNRRAPIAYDIATEQWLDLPVGYASDTYFYGLYVDPLDGKWFLGAYIVQYLNPDNSAWTMFDTNDTTKFPHSNIQYALMDGAGNMWFQTTFIYGKVSVAKKDPEGGDPTWIVFARNDASGFLGNGRVYTDRTGDVWNDVNQKFDPATNTWATQTDTTLFTTRPLHFLNGGIPANMNLAGALPFVTSLNQDLMTVDTKGNIYFCAGLGSINAGIVVRSPVRGDIDRDGVINIKDAVMAVQSLSGVVSGVQSAPVELTGDGKVDSADTLYLLQVLAGARPPL